MISKYLSNTIISELDQYTVKYQASSPYPHIILDDFFDKVTANFLSNNFPKMEDMPNIFREPMSYKGQLSDIDGKWPKFSEIFNFLQSVDFTNFLSSLTGIPDLLPDPMLAGGGLHQSPKSGFLDIHVDANYHPINKDLHRRVNIIIYLTEDWQTLWGGDLELWDDNDKQPGNKIKTIKPIYNRAVIFNTTRTSWHGVSPVECPADTTRKSLALYYYTKTRPSHEQYHDSSVIWMNKSDPIKRFFYPILNFTLRILKPYAKFIRRNVFDSSKNKF